MEDPVAEIPHVIHLLTQSKPSVQRATIERFFTPSASLTHPFARTGSWEGSRWAIIQIFRFYKIMSPRIELDVESVALDPNNLKLYISLSQVFRLWIVPFYAARVHLTTVLTLTTNPPSQPTFYTTRPVTGEGADAGPHSPTYSSTSSTLGSDPGPGADPDPDALTTHDERTLYYITSQNDLYQTNEFVKFVLPFGVGSTVMWLWQIMASIFCIIGAMVWWPLTWAEENELIPFQGLNIRRKAGQGRERKTK